MEIVEKAEDTGTGSQEGLIDQLFKGLGLDPVKLLNQAVPLSIRERPVPVEVEMEALSAPSYAQQLTIESFIPLVRQA